MKKEFDINQRFEFLNNLTKMVVNGLTPSIIVLGQGGLGKTHSVTSTINSNDMSEDDYVFFKGYSTARGLYNTLYDNNGKLIVFDDCDSILEDKVAWKKRVDLRASAKVKLTEDEYNAMLWDHDYEPS